MKCRQCGAKNHDELDCPDNENDPEYDRIGLDLEGDPWGND